MFSSGRRLLLLLLVSPAACSHSEPFPPGDYGTDRPYDPGPPARLTANTGSDGEISFTPDGKFLVYGLSRRCIGFLPAHQARDSEWLCPDTAQHLADHYSYGTLSPTGQLAFVLSQQRYKTVVVAPLADIRDTSDVIPVPFLTTVDGIWHDEITRLSWLRGDTLAILADGVVYLTDVASRARPRVFLPLALPDSAYSMEPDPAGGILYLRVAGDPRVLAWDLTTGGLSTFYDLGTIGDGLASVGTRHLAVVTPGALLRINRENGRTDTIPSFNLVIGEVAMLPDGSDIIVSAVDTTPGSPAMGTTDLYRLVPRGDRLKTISNLTFTQVSAGSGGGCALTNTGKIYCWAEPIIRHSVADATDALDVR
jgi:hypothetical protein